MHTAIKELEDEAQTEGSILNRSEGSKIAELDDIVQHCRLALVQLEKLLTKYKSLGTKRKFVWDRIRFGAEGLQAVRGKLSVHTGRINLFLTTLGIGSLGRIEKKLDEIVEEIRGGRRAPTILTAVDDDDESAEISWDILKTELLDEGFTRQELERHKSDLKAYLQELIEKGKTQVYGGSTNSEIPANTHPQSGVYHATSEDNANPQDRALLGLGSDSLKIQEQDNKTLPINVQTRSHPSMLPRSHSEDCAVEDRKHDTLQLSSSPTENSGSFLSESDPFRSTQSCCVQDKIPPPLPPPMFTEMDGEMENPSWRSASRKMSIPSPSLVSTPISTFKRPASAMSEEYREESSEFDESGRLRKHTVIQRSNSSNSNGSAAHKSPNPFFRFGSHQFHYNLGSLQSPTVTTREPSLSPRGTRSSSISVIQEPVYQHIGTSKSSYNHGPKAGGQSGYQLMTLDTGQGPVQAPVDVQAASKMADENRKRNADASARFRQRRKEKRRESSQHISKLEMQIRDIGEEKEHYRIERDYFRNLVYSTSAQAQVVPRMPSPRQRKISPSGHLGSASNSQTQWPQPEEQGSQAGRSIRRRTSTYTPACETPQQSMAAPNLLSGLSPFPRPSFPHRESQICEIPKEKYYYRDDRDTFRKLLTTSRDSQDYLQQQETVKELKEQVSLKRKLDSVTRSTSMFGDTMSRSPMATNFLREQPRPLQTRESSVRIESPMPISPPGGQKLLSRAEEALEMEAMEMMDTGSVD